MRCWAMALTSRPRLKPMVLTKPMLVGRRAPLLTTPASAGLEYEDARFKAADGLDLRGWFLPSGSEDRGPAIVFVHGWLWNPLRHPGGHIPVAHKGGDFLPAARAPHDPRRPVLLFHLRHPGARAARRRLPRAALRPAQPRRERARRPDHLRAGRGARLPGRARLSAFAPGRGRGADRRARLLDGGQRGDLRHARRATREGDP